MPSSSGPRWTIVRHMAATGARRKGLTSGASVTISADAAHYALLGMISSSKKTPMYRRSVALSSPRSRGWLPSGGPDGAAYRCASLDLESVADGKARVAALLRLPRMISLRPALDLDLDLVVGAGVVQEVDADLLDRVVGPEDHLAVLVALSPDARRLELGIEVVVQEMKELGRAARLVRPDVDAEGRPGWCSSGSC